MDNDEKGFEAKIKSMYSGGGCSCGCGIVENKKSSLKTVICEKCGKVFKTDRETNMCWNCEKQVK